MRAPWGDHALLLISSDKSYRKLVTGPKTPKAFTGVVDTSNGNAAVYPSVMRARATLADGA